jgi:hypothetical protein
MRQARLGPVHDRNLGNGYRKIVGTADMIALMSFQDIRRQTSARNHFFGELTVVHVPALSPLSVKLSAVRLCNRCSRMDKRNFKVRKDADWNERVQLDEN